MKYAALVVELVGVVLVLAGLAMIWPPLAVITAGGLLLMVGVAMERD